MSSVAASPPVPPAPPAPAVPPAARAGVRPRRLRAWFCALVLAASALASAFFVNVIAVETSRRLDVTATGEHKLSPRTLATLSSLRGTHRLVLAAPSRQVSPVARREVQDVLTEMEHASPDFKATWIDTSGEGIAELRTLAAELVERERAVIEQQAKDLDLAATSAALAAGSLDNAIPQGLLSVKVLVQGTDQKAETNRKFLEERAGLTTRTAADLQAAVARARELLKPEATALGVPATDLAREALLAACNSTLRRCDDLARELSGAVRTNALGDPAMEPLKRVTSTVEKVRDALAAAAEPLQRMPRPDVLRISDALRAERAVIAIGPPGSTLAAVDFDELVPSAEAVQAGVRGASGYARADVRRRAENTAASLLAAMSAPLRPIVVITHAEPRSLLEDSPLFTGLVRRLEQRGIEVVEWRTLQSTDPPKLPISTPSGDRPVVYVSLAPDSSTTGAGELPGTKRAGVLGQALQRVVSSGGSMLVSMNPSVLPANGEKDPTTEVLRVFGLEAATERPIMDETVTPLGRMVQTDAILQAWDQDHPIARAVRGLPTFFGWPIGIRAAAGATPSVTLLYQQDSPTAWAESDWLGFWRTPGDQKPLVPNPPRFDQALEARGPWVVAAAAERIVPGGSTQRLVAVGSNNWFVDFVTQRQAVVDGRAVMVNPGNSELFDASVLWLAGQDGLIGQSPEARSLPVVQPLPARQLSLLRLFVIAGLPVLVLVIGAAYRIIAG